LPAREVVVATLGVMYHADDEKLDISTDGPNNSSDGDKRELLVKKLREATWDGGNRPVFGLATALSVMVFFALCAQCGATLAVIRRETNSWRWPAFTFAYMTALAYAAALIVYQTAHCLGG
jgi:ferrous iron transport protein B